MQYKFSKHSLEQMDTRGISKAIVENILKEPEQVKDENGKKVYQSLIKFENKNEYSVRVFVNTEQSPNLILTVYKTSNIKKYYESKI
jgi:hypothetical protein